MLDNGWQQRLMLPPCLSAGNVGAFPVFYLSYSGGLIFILALVLMFVSLVIGDSNSLSVDLYMFIRRNAERKLCSDLHGFQGFFN